MRFSQKCSDSSPNSGFDFLTRVLKIKIEFSADKMRGSKATSNPDERIKSNDAT